MITESNRLATLVAEIEDVFDTVFYNDENIDYVVWKRYSVKVEAAVRRLFDELADVGLIP